MRVLVTNDDGLHAPGLVHLARAAESAGHDVLAVAPEGNRSGSGAAIGDLGMEASIRCREMPLEGLTAVHSIELDAPPALCVIASFLGAFGAPPDLVLSGINPGLNTGRSTMHSGTVGAAVTAANFGCSAVAVSIAGHEADVRNWSVAADLALSTAHWIAARPETITINLSVPDRPEADLLGARHGALAPFGAIRTEVLGRDAEWLRLGFRPTEVELPEHSDSRLTLEGHVVVTPITPIRATPLAGLEDLLGSLTPVAVTEGTAS